VPHTVQFFAELLAEAGLPPGVFTIVNGGQNCEETVELKPRRLYKLVKLKIENPFPRIYMNLYPFSSRFSKSSSKFGDPFIYIETKLYGAANWIPAHAVTWHSGEFASIT